MSAVIYAAIVVMWAVVLVPMWLKRHDAKTESESVDKFSTAMRTLSRRTSAAPGRRYVVMPQRAHGASVHVSGAAAPAPSRPAAPVRPARPSVRTRPSLVARRRRTLLGLSGALALSLILTVAGAFPWPVPILLIAALIGFCAHLRAEARRAAELVRRRVPAAPVAASARPGISWNVAAPAPVAEPVLEAPSRQPLVAEADRRPPVADPVAEPAVPAAAFAQDDAETQTWEPVPVPLPTYTLKPPAPAFEADPTYSPPVYDPAAHGTTYEDEGESDLDEILARRWAVND